MWMCVGKDAGSSQRWSKSARRQDPDNVRHQIFAQPTQEQREAVEEEVERVERGYTDAVQDMTEAEYNEFQINLTSTVGDLTTECTVELKHGNYAAAQLLLYKQKLLSKMGKRVGAQYLTNLEARLTAVASSSANNTDFPK